MTEPLRVGVDVDALLEGSPDPGTEDKCKQGHQFHIYPANPKFSAYCKRCGFKTRKGKGKR